MSILLTVLIVFYKKNKVLGEMFKTLDFLFLLPYCHSLFAHHLLKQIYHD